MVVDSKSHVVCKNRKTDFGSETLADTDNQRTADAPRIAHGKLQSGGKGFSEQRSARLSHDDGGQRTRKQPDAVQQAFEPGVTASKSVIGAAQMTSQPQKITPAATAMIAATTMSTTRHLLLCFFTTEDSFTVMNVPFSMSRHGKRETSVRRHYPVYVHTVEALASSQPYGPRVCA